MNGFLGSSLTLVWGLIILIWIGGNYFPHVKSVLQNGAPCMGPHSEITVSTWEIVPYHMMMAPILLRRIVASKNQVQPAAPMVLCFPRIK